MKIWIDRILLSVVMVVVAVLVASVVPSLIGGKLEGLWLLLHMAASGVLVVTLPILALSRVWAHLSRFRSSGMQRLGFWSLVLTGLATVASVFVCMLPLPSTDQMHQLILIHRYAGFAMVPALGLLVVGALRWRRIHSIRSATPG